MKRSDAISKLAAVMVDYVDGFSVEAQSINLAKMALDEMEKTGMLPPTRKNPEYSLDEALRYSEHPFLTYDVPQTLNTWEPE